MFCNNCGTQIPPNARSCPNCGAPIVNPEQPKMTKDMLPPEYKVISPWQYFGLQILFSIPIIGFIFLIVFTFSKSNYNRRAYARSFWCSLILGIILAVIAGVAIASSGIVSTLVDVVSAYL